MSDAHCPGRDVLAAYVLGRLEEDQIRRTADHASACRDCQTTLADLDHLTDPLVEHIRRPGDTVTPSLRSAKSATGTSLRPALRPDEIGRLGDYRLLAELGRGGMGIVYKAEDTRLERPVALKVIHPQLGRDETARLRFLREARAAAGLKSDHVVAIHQVGEDGGTVFLAMELLDGETLADRLRRAGRLPWREAARLAAQVAEGLAAAHEAGLIHRDVKPANLWLEAPTGRAKLLDFGLARPAAGASETTGGLILGTPHYMAPEQAARPLDARADLYSLGVVLHQMCAGALPLGEGSDDVMAVLSALATERPADLRQSCPDVPPALASLVQALLAKRPEARPASARAVADTLRRLADDAPPRRWPTGLVMALLLFLAVGGAWLAAGWLMPRPAGDAGPTNDEPHRTLDLLPADYHVLRFSADGRRLATASFTDDDRLVAVWEFPSLTRVATLTGWDPGPRALAEYGRRLKYQVLNGAFAADGRRLALAISGAGDNAFALWDTERPTEPRLLRHGQQSVHTLAFSPDGRLLATGGAFQEQASIKLWDAASGQETRELPTIAPGQWVNGLTFSRDARQLFAGYLVSRKVVVWDVEAGERVEPLGSVSNGVVRPGLTLSADGRSLALPTRDYQVHVLDTTTGATRLTLPTTTESFWGYAFALDGRRLAVPDRGDESVTVWDVATGRRVRTVTPAGRAPRTRGLALSPDGRWLVTVGVAGLAQVWDLDRAD